MDRYLLSLALLIFTSAAAAQVANTGAIGENLCTSDALSGVIGGADADLSDGQHSVLLSWVASTSSGVNWSSVYRGTSSSGPWTLIASPVCGTTYTDPTVVSGQALYYAVTATACNASGCNEGGKSTPAGPVLIPLYDTLSGQQALQRGTSESLSTSDALTARKSLHVTVSDTLSTSDSVAAKKTLHRAVSDSLSTSDQLGAIFLDPNSASFTDSLTTSDSLNAQQALGRSLQENLVTTDSLTGQQGHATQASGPPPTIYLLSNYGAASAGTCGLTVQIAGNHFNSLAIAQWNGADRATVVNSSTWLSMTLTSADLASPGNFAITVSNPGNQLSPPAYFWVLGAPAISGVIFTQGALRVAGSNFSQSTVVLWNGIPLITRFRGSDALLAFAPAGTRALGANVVTVANTGCGF